MDEPVWIDKPETLIAHAKQLAEHGGPDGIRDESLLDSALAIPRNVYAYRMTRHFRGWRPPIPLASLETTPLWTEIDALLWLYPLDFSV
jgi:hypothetical protein